MEGGGRVQYSKQLSTAFGLQKGKNVTFMPDEKKSVSGINNQLNT